MITSIVLAILLAGALWFLCGSLAYHGAKELKEVYNFKFPEIFDDSRPGEFFAMGPMAFTAVYSRGIYILFIWRPFRHIRKAFRLVRNAWIEAGQDVEKKEERARIKKGWDK